MTFFTGAVEGEASRLDQSWSSFERCTGIRVVQEPALDESALRARAAHGDAPDLALTPSPGTVADLVHQADGNGDRPLAAPSTVSDNVDRYWNHAFRTYGSVDGILYAAPLGASPKSLVWYSPKRFQKLGYTVPTTWNQLITLSRRIAASGSARPWCGGIGAGSATGWPATDWLEQIVLGEFGGRVYDDWITHKIKFASPQIEAAMEHLAGWMKNGEFVNGGWGGIRSVATTNFVSAGRPILDGTCFMLQQASYYTAQWQTFDPNVTIGPAGDIYAFYLPAINPKISTRIVGGGEFVLAFSDRPEVRAFQTYLSSPEWASSRAALGGWTTANSGVPLDLYTDPIERLSATYLADPDALFRFDASDLMPPEVGFDAEWKQLTAWFAQDKPTREVLEAIDAAWPTSP